MRFIIILLFCFILSACGTIRHHSDNPQPDVYGGTKDDLKTLGHVNGPISAVLVIIDIPLSVIADTVMAIGRLFSAEENKNTETTISSNEETKQ